MKRIYACIAIVAVLLGVAFYSSWKVQSFAEVISADLDAAAEAIRNADHPAARQALADGAAQCAQLARLCTQTVQSFWQQGIDLVHLQQRSALQYGVGREKITIKNDCPQLQTVVRFLPG